MADAEQVAERLRDVVVEFGLREARATTDTHIVHVREPGLWESGLKLQTTIEEIDL